ncbi:MAG: acetate--CoA ligase family protein [Reyranellaceae bacterium]
MNEAHSPPPRSGDADAVRCLFEPRSIAFVGASESQAKIGGRRWKSLVEGGFAGRLYPVNPGTAAVLGHRAYRSVAELPEAPDLVIVSVAAGLVPGVVAECAALGVGAVMVITGGFGESGAEGRRLERDMAARLLARGARLVGPNCAALFSGPAHVNVGGWPMAPGPIALVSQSGNIAIDFARYADQTGSGFSRSITIGNAVDLGVADFVAYFLDDPHTRVVLCYVEGFRPGEGRRLVDLMRSRRPRKPVVLLKPGRSEAGRRAALSHTGALAGEDAVVDAALREAGIVRADSVEAAWQVARALALQPPCASGRIAVLTDGGGHATLASDALGAAGLAMADFAPGTVRALGTLLPERCPRHNPVDFAGEAEGNPDVIPHALELVLADQSVGAAVIVGHFGGYHLIGGPSLAPLEDRAADRIVEVAARMGKPVLLHSVHGDRDLPALARLEAGGVPVFRRIEMPATVLHGMHQAFRLGNLPARSPTAYAMADALPADPDARRRQALSEAQGRALLAQEGLPLPPCRLVASARECRAAVEEFARPCALKMAPPQAIHKSELGGVLLDVAAAEAEAGFERLAAGMRQHGLEPCVLVTPMAKGEVECVVGAFRDPQFGPVVMAGLGGTRVELLGDVAFRLAPLAPAEVEAMLAETSLGRIFAGHRGRPRLALEPFATLICAIGDLMCRRDAIVEVDLNPVLVGADAATVVDVRIALETAAEGRDR